MWKSFVLRHYARLSPAFRLAGAAYRRTVLSYDAFDEGHREVEEAVAANLARVLSVRGTFELWAAAKDFEASFARSCGRRVAVGLGSGTAALELALLAMGVGPGDEVVTCAHTWIATVLAIARTGATPVLVDARRSDLTIDPALVGRALTPRTKVLLPVHMHGHVADVPALRGFGLPILEDCAQAHGARLRGTPVPIAGTGCFSFYATKPLGGAGNGGMVVSDDDALAARVDRARDPESGDPLVLGAGRTPSYLDALEAAVLAAHLPRLEARRRRRAENAAFYAEQLRGLAPVAPAPGVESAWYSFVVRLEDRDARKASALRRGVETRVEYTPSLVASPVFARYGWRLDDFPVAREAALHGLSVPVHPFLTPADRARVVRALG